MGDVWDDLNWELEVIGNWDGGLFLEGLVQFVC